MGDNGYDRRAAHYIDETTLKSHCPVHPEVDVDERRGIAVSIDTAYEASNGKRQYKWRKGEKHVCCVCGTRLDDEGSLSLNGP